MKIKLWMGGVALAGAVLLSGCVTPGGYVSGGVGVSGGRGYISGGVGGTYPYGGYGRYNRDYGRYGNDRYGYDRAQLVGYDRYGRPIYRTYDGRLIQGGGSYGYPSYPGYGYPSYPGYGYPSYPGYGYPSYPGGYGYGYPSYPGNYGYPNYPSRSRPHRPHTDYRPPMGGNNGVPSMPQPRPMDAPRSRGGSGIGNLVGEIRAREREAGRGQKQED